MGKGMLKNLAAKLPNAKFYVWNRSLDPVNEVISQYAAGKITSCESPRAVVEECDVTFCMLSTMEASQAVFDDTKDGVIVGVSEGKLIVDCATLTPERMLDEAKRISAKGGLFVEAPVSGSKGPAEQGTLIFLCGGGIPPARSSLSSMTKEGQHGADESQFNRIKVALDAMGKASFFFGPVGQGTRVKLIVNMVMGTMMTSFSEGLSLTEAIGLPVDKVLEVIDLGAIACPMYKLKGMKMAKQEFATNFPLKHAQKDMRFALQLASQVGLELPTTKTANDEYLKVISEVGDDDFAAVHTVDRKIKQVGFWSWLFASYKFSLQSYPIYTKSLTSCSIAIVGEVIASVVKGLVRNEKVDINLHRIGVFGLYGLVITGPLLHVWYSFLEWFVTKKMKLSGGAKTLVKLLIDRGIWGPPFVLLTIAFIQFLQTISPKKTAEAIQRSYVAVLIANQKTWIPGQLINFHFINPEYQVLFVNAVNVGWNTYLSMSQ